MGLFSTLKNLFEAKDKSSSSVLNGKSIGNTDPICPYCFSDLLKFPGRKKKCPKCGQFIFVRTRPCDKKKILIKEDQIIRIDELWSIENGTHNQFLAERKKFSDQKNELMKETGETPSDNQIKWALLKKDLITHSMKNHWGLYRSDILAMAMILMNESKTSKALDTFLKVFFLDINGPNNCGTYSNPDLIKKYPPFNPQDAFIAPGIINYINTSVNILKIEMKQLEERFMVVADETKASLNLPVAGENAWKKLKKELL